MKKIKLTQGKFALVDDNDFERLNQFKWCAAGNNKNNYFYAIRTIAKKNIGMHRVILNAVESIYHVDHIDGDTLNNQKSNLRLCTNSENRRNQKLNKKSTTGYKGVSIRKINNTYRSQIKFNSKTICIGHYKTAIEAAKAYNEKAKELHGEFARLNIIPEANNDH